MPATDKSEPKGLGKALRCTQPVVACRGINPEIEER